MPRGGKGEPDGFSPYKTAEGRDLKLLKSSASKTRYFNIVEQHPGKFYPKKKLDGVPGSKKMKVFGKGQATAREAAIILANHMDSPQELPEAPPRAPCVRDPYQKKQKRLAELTAEAHRLLGISEEEAEEAAVQDRADYEAWRASQPVVCDAPPIVVQAYVEPAAAPVRVVPAGTSAETLALVERIQAAAPARA